MFPAVKVSRANTWDLSLNGPINRIWEVIRRNLLLRFIQDRRKFEIVSRRLVDLEKFVLKVFSSKFKESVLFKENCVPAGSLT